VRAGSIVVAVGARDRAVPFPGWTLPGVMTAGGVQNLLKSFAVVPGRRIAVAGSGPLLPVVALSLRRAGAEIVRVSEAAPGRLSFRELARLGSMPSLLSRGVKARVDLARYGIPLVHGETVIEARGDERVREIALAPINASGQVDRSRMRRMDVDTLVVGFGFTPSVELTDLLGCAHRHDGRLGGRVPVRNDLETTVRNVFAAGDAAGIGGMEVALAEGRLAGLLASRRLGRSPSASAVQEVRWRVQRLRCFRDAVGRLYAPPPFATLCTDETLVCRCEEVTLGELRARLDRGVTTVNALRAVTRTGMGRCQGRNCMATVLELAGTAARAGRMAARDGALLGLPAPRPPARPILLSDLTWEELPPPRAPEMLLP
jgi:NADPH-dependent 2,4-dienoyl-CoA reductase/sulfur reductase-like enzyme